MNKWTVKETQLLAENYNKVTNDVLMSMFPQRSFLAIYKKARKLGFLKDSKVEFLNRSKSKKGENAHNWNGGKRITSHGYIQVLIPDHPRADSGGYVMEHIYIFEKETGITVPNNCVIHHIDGNKQNNDISNLCMMSFGGHTRYHNMERRKKYE